MDEMFEREVHVTFLNGVTDTFGIGPKFNMSVGDKFAMTSKPLRRFVVTEVLWELDDSNFDPNNVVKIYVKEIE